MRALIPPFGVESVGSMALNLVFPKELGDDAQRGDMDSVCAWLDSGGSVDAQEADGAGFTLLNCCAFGSLQDQEIREEQLALARVLVARGANVNLATRSVGALGAYKSCYPLHFACSNLTDCSPAMVSLLLAAGALVNARCADPGVGDEDLYTPLAWVLKFHNTDPQQESSVRICLDIVTMLLRAGASLDACGAGGGNVTAETMWYASSYHVSEDDEHWVAVKALLDGVRAAGSYKRYMRTPHRDVLAVRGLAQRGKLSTSDPVLNFLARLGDNGVVWHVLEYWRATN